MHYRLHAAISCSIPRKEGYLGAVDLGIKLCERWSRRAVAIVTQGSGHGAPASWRHLLIRSINIVFTIVAIITWLKFCCALLAWYLAPLDILIGPRREIPSGGGIHGGILSQPRRTHNARERGTRMLLDITTYTNEPLHQ